MATDAVLFISFGGPEKPNEIMPFLKIVTHGRGIPEARLKNVAHHYEDLGGASPINALTAEQAKALEAKLAANQTPLPVYIGQKNWKPFLIHTLKQMAEDGIQEAVGFITAAHRTESSHESYIRSIQKAKTLLGNRMPHITYPDPWHTHPLFIDAICARIQERMGVSGKEYGVASWLFVAHSIPTPMANRSQYAQELNETAALVCKKLGKPTWTITYCSRSGRPTDPWLEPDVSDAMKEQAARGVKNFVIIPIGFVVDHVEVLFDLDREAKETADELGSTFTRVATVGSHPLFVDMMADVVAKTTQKTALRIVPQRL